MLAEASLLVVLSVQQGSDTEGCLGQAELAQNVEKRLKRRVFVTEVEASLRLDVKFIKKGDDTEAQIAIASVDGTPRGTRTLVTPGHCSSLDDSLSLSVALLVDQPPDPEPPAEPAPTAPTAPSSKPPQDAVQVKPARPPGTPITLPDDVAAPREPWHLRFGAAGIANYGALPDFATGLALYFRILPRNFYPITVQGEGFWPTTAERDAGSGARFRLLRVGLALCPAISDGVPWAFSACVGQKIGWISVEGYGFDRDAKDKRLTYSVTAGAEARLRLLPAVSLRGYLGVEAPLMRDRFASAGRNAAELFTPSIIAVSGEIGLQVALR
jgi:hypothetical protein